MAQVKEVFDLFDVDGTRTITAAAFPLALRATGLAPTSEEMTRIQNEAVKDGAVSLEAFQAAFARNQSIGRGRPDSAMAAFAVFDKRDNGTVSAQEWRHVMTSVGDKLADDEADYMIADSQPDKSGAINYKSFVDKIK